MTALSTVNASWLVGSKTTDAPGNLGNNATAGSIFRSPDVSMQTRHQLSALDPDERQWAFNIIDRPDRLEEYDPIPNTLAWRYLVSYKVSSSYNFATGDVEQIYSIHQNSGNSAYGSVYLTLNNFGNGNEPALWWNAGVPGYADTPQAGETADLATSVYSAYTRCPIGEEFFLEIRGELPRNAVDQGWVEIAVNDRLEGSATAITDQFVPRTSVKLTRTNGNPDTNIYFQFGMGTVDASFPSGVTTRYVDTAVHSVMSGSY